MSRAKRVAYMGVLFALALVLAVLESWLAPVVGLPPGVKPGLSNVVVMYALLFMGTGPAVTLGALKAFFALITRGPTAGWMSLCGAGASILVMLIVDRVSRRRAGHLVLSVCGAVAHGMGQLAAASVLLGSGLAFGYAPILLISGILTGALTGVLLRAVLPALQRLGLHHGA